MTFKKEPVIYIGYDEREKRAFEVCCASIKKTASRPINIIPLKQEAVRHSGLFFRTHYNMFGKEYQKYDAFDGKPYSTDFSFTRFLVPALNQYEGKALFMDCDMMVREDIWQVFTECNARKPVYAVPHNYTPEEGPKMDGKRQEQYNKKNWSSFMVFDCGHAQNKNLTPHDVSTKKGQWLHEFAWLDSEDDIGHISEEWNWLDHWSHPSIKAKNVHFTTGGPWFDDWRPANRQEELYALEWKEYDNKLTYNESMDF